MNILYLKYAIEVARTGSMSKAAENLFVAQPNLSRSIKELESSLCITIFERKNNGVTVTPEGERFLRYGRRIVQEIDEVEALFGGERVRKKAFSVSVPRSGYITAAFAEFSGQWQKETAGEFCFEETGGIHAIDNVLHEGHKLGIVRYCARFDGYFKSMIEDKALEHELVAEFAPVLTVSRQSPLAGRTDVVWEELKGGIELICEDLLPEPEREAALCRNLSERRILVNDRASRLELLSCNPETYLWGEPLPEPLLERYALSTARCTDRTEIYKDVLLYRKDYSLSALDKRFITSLCNARRKFLGGF